MHYFVAAVFFLLLLSVDFEWWLVVGALALVMWLFSHA